MSAFFVQDITRNKSAYYEYLQAVRESGGSEEAWEKWILYILRGIEVTATETIELVQKIAGKMKEYKHIIRKINPKMYSHDLLNCLFYSPYTKMEHLEAHLGISRPTAAKYLDELVSCGLLKKEKIWRRNYYINTALVAIFTHAELDEIDSVELVRTVESS